MSDGPVRASPQLQEGDGPDDLFREVVRNFSRYNKYTLGTELRERSREIVGVIIKANSTVERLPVLLDLREKLEGSTGSEEEIGGKSK